MKAVIYARYSSDAQREESIEGQLRECMEFAERQGITVLQTYIDRALSAKTDNRPQFQRMIKDSGKHLFDAVIVWKLDRFSRNRYDSAHNKAILRKNGVKVISATENIAEDSTGILLESLLEGYAEFFSAELSEKVQRGHTENALKCKYNGGTIPLGLSVDQNQKYILDPIVAPLILDAFNLYNDGATAKQVADKLYEKGLRSKDNTPLRVDRVVSLLRNRKYIGEYRYRDIVHENAIPQIIPTSLFNQVQERLAKNKKAPARFKAKEEFYLLTTKLFCGRCGSYMAGESGVGRNGVHRYYKCVSAKKKQGCKKKATRKAWIEETVVAETMDMLLDDKQVLRLIDLVMDLQKKENTALPLLQKQLKETNKAIENLLNAIQQGIFNNLTKERLDTLEQTKSDLETKIAQEEMLRPQLTREQVAFWMDKFRNLDVSVYEQRQLLVDTFVNSIYLHDDKLIIGFNYKGGIKTLTLDESSAIISSDSKGLDGSNLADLLVPACRWTQLVV